MESVSSRVAERIMCCRSGGHCGSIASDCAFLEVISTTSQATR
jgi:hypothetical protein